MRRIPTYRLLLLHRSAPATIAGVGTLFSAVRLDAPLPAVMVVAAAFGAFRASIHLRDASASVERARPAPARPVQAAAALRVRILDAGLIAVAALLTIAIVIFAGTRADTLSALLTGMLLGEAIAHLVVVTWVAAFERAESVLLVCRDREPAEPATVRGREVTPLWRVREGPSWT